MPREEIEPGETLESYFGRTKKRRLTNIPLNNFILRNYGLGENKYPKNNDSKSTNPFQDEKQLQDKFDQLNKLSIQDAKFQEEIHKLLDYSNQERKKEHKSMKERAHFPLRFTPNLKSKSKWQVRWHPKVAALVKYAYQIFHGSINTNNPSFHPKLREILQYSKRCLVCRLTNQEWKHPKGIITAGNQEGRCSAKVADTLVPQMATNVVNLAETFNITTESIKFLRNVPQATIPTKGTMGSAAYDLYPLQEEIVPPRSRKQVSTGLSCEFPSTFYGHITSRSGMSVKHSVDVVTGILEIGRASCRERVCLAV